MTPDRLQFIREQVHYGLGDENYCDELLEHIAKHEGDRAALLDRQLKIERETHQAIIKRNARISDLERDLAATRELLHAARLAPGPQPAMHLSAQMGELRAKLDSARSGLRSVINRSAPVAILTLTGVADDLDDAMRLVPIQHDDQQGGKPEEVDRG